MRFSRTFALATMAVLLGSCAGKPSAGLPTARDLAKEPALRTQGLGLGGLQFDTSQSQFPSGLRFGHERVMTNGMVGVVVTVGVGAAADPPNQEGLAHFVEHIVFRSRHDEGPPMDVRLKLTGASGINATTSPDVTSYFAFVPAQNFPAFVKLMGLMLARPIDGLSAQDVQTEREVIKNELRERDETGIGGQLRGWIAEALVPIGDPYRRPIGGTLASVDALNVEGAQEFARTHYQPDNVSIMVISEQEPSRIESILKAQLAPEWIGDESASKKPRLVATPSVQAVIPPEPSEGAYTHYASIEQPTLVVTWRMPSVYSDGGHIAQIVSAPTALRELEAAAEALEEVHSASVWANHYLQSTVIICVVELNDPLAWTTVSKKLRGFYTEALTPYNQAEWAQVASVYGSGVANQTASGYARHLSSVRQRTTAESLFSSESFARRIHDLAGFLHFENNLNGFAAQLLQIQRTSYRELASILPNYLSAAHARVLNLHAKRRPQVAPVAGAGVLRQDVLSEIAEHHGDAAELRNPPRTRRDAAFDSVREANFPNGLKVIALRRPAYPTIAAVLAFRTGTAASLPLGAESLVRALEEHGPSLSAGDSGIRIDRYTESDFSGDIVVAGRANLPRALSLLSEQIVTTDKAYNWDWVMQALRKRTVPNPSLKPEILLGQELMQNLYPASPLAKPITFRDMQRVSSGQMTSWLARSRHPSNATLVMAGDLDPAVALKWAARIFGNWAGAGDRPDPTVIPAPLPPLGPMKVIVKRGPPDEPQVQISMVCRLPNAVERSEATYDALSSVVGGWLATRLRQEAGLAYGVGGGARIYRGGGAHMSLSLSVDRTHLAKALRVVRGHWQGFVQNGFDPGSLSQAKWSLTAASNFGSTTSLGLALGVASAAVKGWRVDHRDRYRNDVGAVMVQDLQDAFGLCAQTTTMGLVGDEAAINAALRETQTLATTLR